MSASNHTFDPHDYIKPALFSLGHVMHTEGVKDFAHKFTELLRRHIRGQWGVVTDEEKGINNRNIAEGAPRLGRVLSAYLVEDEKEGLHKLYVVTDIIPKGNITTICLNDEL